MNTLILSFASSIIIALLSGAAYLAIKHYNVYDEIFTKILTFLHFLFFTSIAFISGYDFGLLELSKFIAEQHENISLPKKELSDFLYIFIIAAFIVINVYLFLLDFIGKKIKQSNENQSEN
jgi:ABC-type microcin C transport system permease subunit YejE